MALEQNEQDLSTADLVAGAARPSVMPAPATSSAFAVSDVKRVMVPPCRDMRSCRILPRIL